MLEYTRKKLREARFFLARLEQEVRSGGANPTEAVEFYLSAFLAAGRSVTTVLQSEEPDLYPAWSPKWRASLTKANRQLLAKFATARNRALKRGTPAVAEERPAQAANTLSPDLQFFFEELADEGPLSTGQDRVLKARLTPKHALEEILPACRQYADLLSRLVTDFVVDAEAGGSRSGFGAFRRFPSLLRRRLANLCMRILGAAPDR
jgi:hypothetical protein